MTWRSKKTGGYNHTKLTYLGLILHNDKIQTSRTYKINRPPEVNYKLLTARSKIVQLLSSFLLYPSKRIYDIALIWLFIIFKLFNLKYISPNFLFFKSICYSPTHQWLTLFPAVLLCLFDASFCSVLICLKSTLPLRSKSRFLFYPFGRYLQRNM